MAALCRYAGKLTLTPSKMEREDIEQLRAAGFDDRAIVDANWVVSYYNYVNRVADGVGIELEDGWSGEAHPALRPDRSLVERPSDRFEDRSQASNGISIVGSQTFEELLRRPVGSRP